MSDIVKSSGNAPINIFDPAQFQQIRAIAETFSRSDLVPKNYQQVKGNEEKAISNCIIAFDIAARMGANFLMVMQHMVPIQGKPTFSAEFIVAAINSSGIYEDLKYTIVNKGQIKDIPWTSYSWNGNSMTPKQETFKGPVDNLSCIAWTTKKGSNERLESSEITVEMAIREGWWTKNGSKWPNMTQHMLEKRAATFWKTKHAPQITIGFPSTEEIRDIQEVEHEEVSTKLRKDPSSTERQTVEINDPMAANMEPVPSQPEPDAKPEKKTGKKAAAQPQVEPVKEPEPVKVEVTQKEPEQAQAPNGLFDDDDLPSISHD